MMQHSRSRRGRSARRAFTLVEAMIVMTVLSIIAVGAGVGLQSLTKVPEGNETELAVSNALVDKMESLRGMSVTALLAATNLSDSVTVNGKTLTRTVSVATADPNGGSAVQTDFIRITVTIGSRSMSCFVTQP